jgi:phosphatidylglycerol:prolipoprotein diacylglycerol transferase
MIPQIFSVFGFPINSFGLCVALSIFAASLLMARSFVAFGLPADRAENYVFFGGITGLIGARIWFLLFNIPMVINDPLGTIFSSAGFIFYGGFIFAFLVLYLMSRKDSISFLSFLDAAGPSMCLGYAIGRLGCQLSGDGDYGKMTDSVFGMSYQTGVVPTPPGILVYPTPLYESAICLIILFFLLKLEQKKDFGIPGRWFGVYILLVSIERFFVEFLRIEPRFAGGLSQAQYISLFLIIAGSGLIFFRRKV